MQHLGAKIIGKIAFQPDRKWSLVRSEQHESYGSK